MHLLAKIVLKLSRLRVQEREAVHRPDHVAIGEQRLIEQDSRQSPSHRRDLDPASTPESESESTGKRHLYLLRSEMRTLPHHGHRQTDMRMVTIVDRDGAQNMGSVWVLCRNQRAMPSAQSRLDLQSRHDPGTLLGGGFQSLWNASLSFLCAWETTYTIRIPSSGSIG